MFLARVVSDSPARAALKAAFADLALSRRYGQFSVETVARLAGVARSTFYYHFAGKDALLLANLAPLIEALAQAPFTTAPSDELRLWTAHIWEKSSVAARLLAGPASRRIEGALAAALRTRLQAGAEARAAQIAGASLALLRAWVGQGATGGPEEIAAALWRGARALAQS